MPVGTGELGAGVSVPFAPTWKMEIVPDHVGTKANFPDGSKVMPTGAFAVDPVEVQFEAEGREQVNMEPEGVVEMFDVVVGSGAAVETI